MIYYDFKFTPPSGDYLVPLLADGLGDDNDGPGETEQFEALADGLDDVDESLTF